MIIDVFLTCLDRLIEFFRLIYMFTIARFCCCILGSFDTGKIGPQEGHHDAQQAKAI